MRLSIRIQEDARHTGRSPGEWHVAFKKGEWRESAHPYMHKSTCTVFEWAWLERCKRGQVRWRAICVHMQWEASMEEGGGTRRRSHPAAESTTTMTTTAGGGKPCRRLRVRTLHAISECARAHKHGCVYAIIAGRVVESHALGVEWLKAKRACVWWQPCGELALSTSVSVHSVCAEKHLRTVGSGCRANENHKREAQTHEDTFTRLDRRAR